jgi:hypothetical protein
LAVELLAELAAVALATTSTPSAPAGLADVLEAALGGAGGDLEGARHGVLQRRGGDLVGALDGPHVLEADLGLADIAGDLGTPGPAVELLPIASACGPAPCSNHSRWRWAVALASTAVELGAPRARDRGAAPPIAPIAAAAALASPARPGGSRSGVHVRRGARTALASSAAVPARRMADTAEHLVAHVLPRVPAAAAWSSSSSWTP